MGGGNVRLYLLPKHSNVLRTEVIMETPKTFPGILTEEILAKANERAGGLPTNFHNAVYSACLEVLNAHLLKPEIKLELPQPPRRFPGFYA